MYLVDRVFHTYDGMIKTAVKAYIEGRIDVEELEDILDRIIFGRFPLPVKYAWLGH